MNKTPEPPLYNAYDILQFSDNSTNSLSSRNISSSSSNHPAVLAFQIIMVFFILFGNGLILVAICQSSAIRKSNFYFTANLAVSDMLFGLALCLRLVLNSQRLASTASCLVVLLAAILSGCCSATGIFFLCLESFVSVKHAMLFRTTFTPRKARLLVAASWAGWALVGGLAVVNPQADAISASECYFGNGYFNTGYTVFVWVALLCLMAVTVTLEAQTLYYLRRHTRTMARAPQALSAVAAVRLEQQRGQLRRLNNTCQLLAAILACYVLTWGPYCVGLMLLTLCTDCAFTPAYLPHLTAVVSCNSAASVVVYAVKSHEYRAAFRRMICCCCSRGQRGAGGARGRRVHIVTCPVDNTATVAGTV